MILPRLLSTAAISASVVGSMVFGAAVDSGSRISVLDGETHIPAGVVCSVGATVVSIAWWLSGRLARLDANLKELSDKMTTLPCNRGDCPKHKK